MAIKACSSDQPASGSTVPSNAATATNATTCTQLSNAVAASLQNSNHQRGNGAVSSNRINPISRSYTIASDDCMPLNSSTMPIRPGAM